MTAQPRRLDLHSIRAATVAAVLAGALAGCAPGGDGELQAQVDAVFADYASADGPGCSLGVIRDGRLIHAAGYGAANLDYGIPNGPATIYRIASVSKQFTAGAIALLALWGEVDLDAPVQRYLPDFPDYADPPTVRHLIHHTSGVRDYLGLFTLAGNRSEDFITNLDILDAIMRQRELNFPPGSEYLYSNSGYVLLAEIVARVAGRSLREFARAEFLDPLGMPRTHFHDDHNEVVPDRATGYSPTEDGFRIDMTTLDVVGDGGIYTSVEEWPAWGPQPDRGHGRRTGMGRAHAPAGRAHLGRHDSLRLRSSRTASTGGWPRWGTAARGSATARACPAIPPPATRSWLCATGRGSIPWPSSGARPRSIWKTRWTRPRTSPTRSRLRRRRLRRRRPRRRTQKGTTLSTLRPTAVSRIGRASPDPSTVPNWTPCIGSRRRARPGLTLRVGRRDPVALVAEADGQLTTEDGPTFRFSELAGGRYEAMVVDAGRVRNLRFARTEG